MPGNGRRGRATRHSNGSRQNGFSAEEKRLIRNIIDDWPRIISSVEDYERRTWVIGFTGKAAKWLASVGAAVGVLRLWWGSGAPVGK